MGERTVIRLGIAAALVAVTVAGGLAAPSTAARVAKTQLQVELLKSHKIFRQPGGRGHAIGAIAARGPLTAERTILPVVEAKIVRKHGVWIHVRLPGRPNGRTGWITRSGTVFTSSPWHVVVDTEARTLQVYRAARLVRTFKVVVGKPSTPTPHGRFYIEESIATSPTAVGAPYAFALSARSNVLQEFEGGPGQIAIHGIANLGGVPGTAVSHGCIRMATDAIRWLAGHVGAGDPVTIR
jgi:lipoprotein-anchoring transpeptidase ErfK/SrfK